MAKFVVKWCQTEVFSPHPFPVYSVCVCGLSTLRTTHDPAASACWMCCVGGETCRVFFFLSPVLSPPHVNCAVCVCVCARTQALHAVWVSTISWWAIYSTWRSLQLDPNCLAGPRCTLSCFQLEGKYLPVGSRLCLWLSSTPTRRRPCFVLGSPRRRGL